MHLCKCMHIQVYMRNTQMHVHLEYTHTYKCILYISVNGL